MNLNRTTIEAAITGFEEQKKKIDATIAELRSQLGGTAPARRGRKPKAAETAPKVE